MVSGLLSLRSFSESICGLFFLVFMWYIMWSANKIRMYMKEGNEVSFIRYYFSYLINTVDLLVKSTPVGPSRLFITASLFLSTFGGIVGISTVLFLNYNNIVTAFATQDLFLKYTHLFFYVSIYPFVILFLRTLASGRNMKGLINRFLTFFPLRFTQLFIYMFTFLTPMAWIMIAFLSYIITKSKTICHENNPIS